MLTLFLEFLSYVARNLAEYATVSNDDVVYRKTLYVYTLLDRVASNFERFSKVLVWWQQHACEGGAWSGAHRCLIAIDHALYLIGEDLIELIGIFQTDEYGIKRCKLRGGPAISKFDVFDIWAGIVHRNAVDRFSGWISDHSGAQVKRTIYIPNYSLLLPVVQRTSELGDISQSRWQQIDFEYLDQVAPKLNRRALTFLPEFPPEFPIDRQEFSRLATPAYAQVIRIPTQDQELIQIIEIARQSISGFRIATHELRDGLLAQSKNVPEKLANVF